MKSAAYEPAGSGRKLPIFAATLAAAVVLVNGSPAPAGVTSNTETRFYDVGGTTQKSLVAAMRANPFRGGGVAHTLPSYGLSVTTERTDGKCRVSNVNLKVDFVVTLPRARESAMSVGTRSAWRSFVSFASRHEQGHRKIYLQCARNYTVKAKRLAASSCSAVRAEAHRLLDAENRACDKRHAAFDRSERRRIGGLTLFRTATR